MTRPPSTAGPAPGPAVTDVHARINAVVKLESARIVAALMRVVHDVGLAEELAQDAVVAALEQWPAAGVPENPGAWLTAIAKRRAVDHIRRSRLHDRKAEQYAREHDQPPDLSAERDDVLRLMFISCHPVLPTEQRAALTLRVVGGLTAAEIARAFLITEPAVARRIATAKRTLAEAGVPFALPEADDLAARLSSVLEVIYLIFNEGYSASSGDDLIRPALGQEALRLGRLLADLAPHEAEVHGLVALMEIQASRSAARTGPAGEPIQLHEQNRGRWDQLLIRRGFTAMLRAREIGGTPGPYVLQAAIAICHAQARTAADTDWVQIAALYRALAALLPTPIVQLNRAVAVGMAEGPQAGLDLANALLVDPALRDYHLLPGVRGDLLWRLGRVGEARQEFLRAAGLARNAAESAFLRGRAVAAFEAEPASAAELGAAESVGRTVGEAVAEFLARDLDAATVRSYGQTLTRLCRAVGAGMPLALLTAEQVSQACAAAWGDAAPRTWNRHVAAIRSFSRWTSATAADNSAKTADIAAGLERRPETGGRTEALSGPALDRLWVRADVGLRERTLWRLLHESGAGVGAVLALNVEDLDLDDRRARSGAGWVSWRAGTARLLPELLAGRTRGPLFLADRRPGPARMPAEADRCPDTGRGRLSYERAEYLFKQATGATLRRLKPG
ncbi:sigma-70 family RNA polymerase sigma factor [Actinoplanes sp. CA-051413]|uniref:sigma-70 family RNA polymerase sigma factor n=1 Tax=Actinoplanes sp. CA-051413 TaxID=3239899 RepID=UPI003D966A24